MDWFTEGAILDIGANVNAPIGLCADVFTDGNHPTGFCHERVDCKSAASVKPVFFEPWVDFGGKRNECIFEAGKRIPAGFDDDAVAQGVE